MLLAIRSRATHCCMARRKTPTPTQRLTDDTTPHDSARQITADEIARRAYDKYLARGGSNGDDVSDWLAAEAELRAQR